MLIHGGPQGEWGESWTYRWNAQVFAGAGYVVVMPNPRGSFGYGQKFTDDINQDWGGKPYDDIMAVTDYVAKLPYVDAGRMAAAGGSYGGYMVDWILGHTNRFKAWSPTPAFTTFASEAEARKNSGSLSGNSAACRGITPKSTRNGLPEQVRQGVPYADSCNSWRTGFPHPLYAGPGSSIRRCNCEKVPSELLVFPDEGHWVLKPQNSALWYKTFLDWVDNWN